MAQTYEALLNGHLDAMELAKEIHQYNLNCRAAIRFPSGIIRDFGYVILEFDEPWSPEEEALGIIGRIRANIKPKRRQMSVFLNGNCDCDYSGVTTEPMTMLSLGDHGDVNAIMTHFLKKYGGYWRNSSNDYEWIRFSE